MDIKTMAETHFKRLQKRLKKKSSHIVQYILYAYDSKGSLISSRIIETETRAEKRRQQVEFQRELLRSDVAMVVSASEAWLAPDDGSRLLPSEHPKQKDCLIVSVIRRDESYAILQPFSVTSGCISWGKIGRAHCHGSDVYSSCTDILWNQRFEWSAGESQKAEGF